MAMLGAQQDMLRLLFLNLFCNSIRLGCQVLLKQVF
jgi:hypothetical protein